MAEFSNIDTELKKILSDNGFTTPTDIQRETLKHSLNKCDILGISKTGSGKTLAFLIPVISSLLKKNRFYHSLILVPTRELALQINDLLMDLGDEIGLRSSLLIGGEDFNLQKESLLKKPHVIIGTPGRVAAHTFPLKTLRFLILDEADKLIEKNFEGDIKKIFTSVGPKKKFQSLLFSATLSKEVESLVEGILKNPRVVEITGSNRLTERFMFMALQKKSIFLYYLLKNFKYDQAIIFVNSSFTARILSHMLNASGMNSGFLYGDLHQEEREKYIERFRKGATNILVATDVAARGLDIPQVHFIINYDVCPGTVYTHRVGRTARGGEEGRAITFVSQYDIYSYQKLEFYLGYKLEEESIDNKFIDANGDKIMERLKDAMEKSKGVEEARKKRKFR